MSTSLSPSVNIYTPPNSQNNVAEIYLFKHKYPQTRYCQHGIRLCFLTDALSVLYISAERPSSLSYRAYRETLALFSRIGPTPDFTVVWPRNCPERPNYLLITKFGVCCSITSMILEQDSQSGAQRKQ